VSHKLSKNFSLLLLLDRWEKFYKGKFVPVISVDNKGKIHGPLLSFEDLEAYQNGTYRCEVINSFGSLSLDVDLIVSSTVPVKVEPQRQTVRVGQNVELECKIPDKSNHAEIT
jgi:hypothetical protein